jgi:hypothetical protein
LPSSLFFSVKSDTSRSGCWWEGTGFQPAGPLPPAGGLQGGGVEELLEAAGSCWKALLEILSWSVEPSHTATIRERGFDGGPSVTTRIFPRSNSRNMASASTFLFSFSDMASFSLAKQAGA